MRPKTRDNHATTPPQTRASDSVRKRHRHQQRPLPFELQVKPPIKRRTPKHPACITNATHLRTLLALCDYPREHFMAGRDLVRTIERWGVRVNGKIVGYHADSQYALGYALAAHSTGLEAEVIDTKLVYTSES